VLVGEDVGPGRAQLQGADDAGGVPVAAGVVDVRHAVHGEGGRVIGDQGAVGGPVVEQAVGDLVAVLATFVDGEVDPDRVVGIAGGEVGPLGIIDDVVGRAHHPGQVHFGEVVTERGEGLESGHGPILADCPAWLGCWILTGCCGWVNSR
jgi:hypothetical protein